MNPMKKCRVCNDIASGFNYDGLSCESCKVFFCRNSTRLEKFKCEQNGNCEINISTRRKCSKCRLIKCFAIGMKKNKSSQIEKTNTVAEKMINKIDIMLEINIRKNIYENKFDDQIVDFVSNDTKNQKQIQQQSKRIPIELNPYELECITTARNAIGSFQYERTAKIIKRAASAKDYFDSSLLNNLVYIKKAIHFCQHFGAFNSLSSDDQVILLKPFSNYLNSIWFTFQYEDHKDGMLMFLNESEREALYIEHEIVYSCYRDHESARKMYEYYNSMYRAMENDVNIRDLLLAILLFRTQQNLSSLENIRYHHYLYGLILQRYLQYKHRNKKEGNRRYLVLTRILDQLDEIVDEFKQVITVNFGTQNMPPLMKELFDLQ